MPLQAEHMSSITSDFIGFIMRATPATNYQSDWYIFQQLRNQLRGVTLLLKVKLNFVLLGLRAIGSVHACRATTTMYWMPMASASLSD